MALEYTVAGPCELRWGVSGADTLGEVPNVIGYTTNDDLFTIRLATFHDIVKSTALGDEPAEVVYTGRVALITGTIVYADLTQLDKLVSQITNGTNANWNTIIGSQYVASSQAIALAIVPKIVGKTAFIFPRVIPDNEFFAFMDFGNTARKYPISFMAIRNNGLSSSTPGDGSINTVNSALWINATTT